jgi:hypothetical protein
MKLFMEINPQLFDECSHEYNEQQNNAEEREKTRRDRWQLLTDQAENRKQGILPPPKLAAGPIAGLDNNGVRADEADSLTQDSQKRLNALKLQDETTTKDRRTNAPERQNSVSISELFVLSLLFLKPIYPSSLTHYLLRALRDCHSFLCSNRDSNFSVHSDSETSPRIT